MATASLCNKNGNDWESPVALCIRWPRSFRNARDSDPIAPRVSKAKGMNSKDLESWAYFSCLRHSASAATALDSDDATDR